MLARKVGPQISTQECTLLPDLRGTRTRHTCVPRKKTCAPSLGVTQLQRAREFISTLGAHQYDSLANLLSENFTHRFLPTSLNGMGMPVRNTQEFLDHLKEVKLAIEEFNLEEKDVIQGQDVVVLHLLADGKTVSGKPYNNEYMFTFRFDGEKIASVKEFMDSKYVTQVLEGEEKAREEKNS